MYRGVTVIDAIHWGFGLVEHINSMLLASSALRLVFAEGVLVGIAVDLLLHLLLQCLIYASRPKVLPHD